MYTNIIRMTDDKRSEAVQGAEAAGLSESFPIIYAEEGNMAGRNNYSGIIEIDK